MTEIQLRLFELQDLKYRDFHAALMPTVDKETVIGVRMPQLRALAKELKGTELAAEFVNILPHKYYEENNLHGMFVSEIKDFNACLAEMEKFLPYMDNWATCDLTSPKCFKKHKAELLEAIKRWLASDKPYTVRFGINMLMSHYLDEDFKPEYLDLVSAVRSEEYYVRMVQAWYFATALAKQYDAALPYIENQRLEKWTHNKTIQKARESFRVLDEHKAYLKTLKV